MQGFFVNVGKFGQEEGEEGGPVHCYVFLGGGRDLLRLVCRGYFVDGVVEVREGGGGDVCGFFF